MQFAAQDIVCSPNKLFKVDICSPNFALYFLSKKGITTIFILGIFQFFVDISSYAY